MMLKGVHTSAVYSPQEVKTLYYELTEYPIQEFEWKEEIRVTWSPDGGARIHEKQTIGPGQSWMTPTTISILVPYESKYQDVIDQLCEKLDIPVKHAIRLVMVDTKHAVISRIINLDDVIVKENRQLRLISLLSELRAELILPEEAPVDSV